MIDSSKTCIASFTLIASVTALVFISSCEIPMAQQRASVARSRVQLVPGGGSTYFAFTENTVYESDGKGKNTSHDLGFVSPGRATASATDLATSRACVVFDKALAIVDLEQGRWTWRPATWTSTPDSVAAAKGKAITLSKNVAQLWDLVVPGEPITQDLSPWLKRHSMTELHLASPMVGKDDQIVLVASHYPHVVVSRVTTAKGDWRDVAGDELSADLNRLERASIDGEFVYLAGESEYNGFGNGGQLELAQDFVVYRIDLDRGERVELLRVRLEESTFDDVRVDDLAAGKNMFAVLLGRKDHREQLRIYRISEERGGAAAMIWESSFPSGAALAFLPSGAEATPNAPIPADKFAVWTEDHVKLVP